MLTTCCSDASVEPLMSVLKHVESDREASNWLESKYGGCCWTFNLVITVSAV